MIMDTKTKPVVEDLLKCPQCGANMELTEESGREKASCPYCGYSRVLERELTPEEKEALIRQMYGEGIRTRFRPSFFPFTEPSAEVDLTCANCRGEGCRMCKGTGWIEVLGAGMVNPKVLEMCGIDSRKYSGFAFGMGVERISLLKYNIPNLRYLYENDLRFLTQYR